MQTEAQWSSLLTPVIQHHFMLGMSMIPSIRGELFRVQGSLLAEEKGTGIGGFGVDAWDVWKNSGGRQKGQLNIDQLYTQTYTHLRYPVQLTIDKALLANDQYRQIETIIRRTGMSAEQKMENDGVSVLNNAFSASYLGSDGVALCSASHPKSPHEASSVYSNTGTTALTATAVSDTRISMMRYKDDKGNPMNIVPDELWVPPELEDKAIKIVGSQQEPGTANNDTNPQAGRWRVRPLLRLTGTKAWFMTASAWRREVVNWYNRQAMQVMLIDETTTDLVYEILLYYSFGFDDWRWIFGHNPA